MTSRARQREQARVPVVGHSKIVAKFLDSGHSRMLPWARRWQAVAEADAGATGESCLPDQDAGAGMV